MPDPDTERLQHLEASVAHLERLCEQLNEVVTEQSRELAQLRKQLGLVANSLEGIESERIKDTNPKPPHYQ